MKKTALGAIAAAMILTVRPMPTSAEQVAALPSYSADEVAWSRAAGTNRIEGSAEIPGSPAVKTCAGENVWLRPRSVLEDHRIKVIFGNLERARIPVVQYLDRASYENANMPLPPKAYDEDARKLPCSAGGKFTAENIPDGDYYAIVMVFPGEYLGKITPIETIDAAMRRVTVGGGQTVTLDILADR